MIRLSGSGTLLGAPLRPVGFATTSLLLAVSAQPRATHGPLEVGFAPRSWRPASLTSSAPPDAGRRAELATRSALACSTSLPDRPAAPEPYGPRRPRSAPLLARADLGGWPRARLTSNIVPGGPTITRRLDRRPAGNSSPASPKRASSPRHARSVRQSPSPLRASPDPHWRPTTRSRRSWSRPTPPPSQPSLLAARNVSRRSRTHPDYPRTGQSWNGRGSSPDIRHATSLQSCSIHSDDSTR